MEVQRTLKYLKSPSNDDDKDQTRLLLSPPLVIISSVRLFFQMLCKRHILYLFILIQNFLAVKNFKPIFQFEILNVVKKLVFGALSLSLSLSHILVDKTIFLVGYLVIILSIGYVEGLKIIIIQTQPYRGVHGFRATVSKFQMKQQIKIEFFYL